MPAANVPAGRTLGQLLDEVEQHLALCRRGWWQVYGDTCLVNKWVLVSAVGVVTVLKRKRGGAKQVLGGRYDPGSNALVLALSDGATTAMNAGDGVVER